MKKIKAILFDMDGVLVESEAAHAGAWLNLIKDRGVDLTDTPIKMENYIGAFDLKVAEDLKKFYGNLFPENAETLVELKRDYFFSWLKEGKSPLPVPKGRDQFLDFLDQQGIVFAVVSSCSRKEIEATLKSEKIDKRFQFMVGVDDVKNPKPDPDPYLMGLAKLGLQKDEVLVIEDSISGVTSARRAGLQVLGLATSYEKLDQFPEVTFYKNYEEIRDQWIY